MSIYPRLWPVSGALPRSGYIPKPRVRAPIGHRPGTVLAWSALVGVGRRTLGEQAATTLRTAKRCNIRGTLSGCEGSLLLRHPGCADQCCASVPGPWASECHAFSVRRSPAGNGTCTIIRNKTGITDAWRGTYPVSVPAAKAFYSLVRRLGAALPWNKTGTR